MCSLYRPDRKPRKALPSDVNEGRTIFIRLVFLAVLTAHVTRCVSASSAQSSSVSDRDRPIISAGQYHRHCWVQTLKVIAMPLLGNLADALTVRVRVISQ